jgi:hypothetical protein
MNTKQRNEKAANFPSLVYYNRWRTRTFESVKKNQALKSAAGGHNRCNLRIRAEAFLERTGNMRLTLSNNHKYRSSFQHVRRTIYL